MSLTDMVIMPGADYQAACDAIREKTKGVGYIRSGDMAELIRGTGNVQYFTLPMGRSRGDVNGDGKINEADANLVYPAPTDEVERWCADITGDGANTASDKSQLSRFLAGMDSAMTVKPTMADYYGNWTWLKIDDTSGYFYYDLEVDGVTADTNVTVLTSKYKEVFLEPICLDGVVRVCAAVCPPEETECCVLLDAVDWSSVPAPKEPESYKLAVQNYGSGTFMYLSKNHRTGTLVGENGATEDELYENDLFCLLYDASTGNHGADASETIFYVTGVDQVNPVQIAMQGTFTGVAVYRKVAGAEELALW